MRLHRPRLARPLTVSVLALLSALPASAQDAFEPRFRVLAEQGDELPDRSDAELGIIADPTFLAIDRSGRVFFDGTATSEVPGASTFRGFFVADGESARTVFAVGDAAPTGGIATGAAIEGIVEAFYGADGQALIAAELDGGSLPGEALLTDVDGSKRVAAVVGTAFGGACGYTDFGNGFASSQFALNEGVLVLHGIRDRTLCGNSFRELLRTTDLSTFLTLTLENAPVPGVSNAEFEHIFSGASLATDGSYAFTGNYIQEEGPGEQIGLFVAAPDGGVRQVIATRTTAPGTSDEITALRIWQVRSAEETGQAARTAYVATFFNGVTTDPMHVYDSASVPAARRSGVTARASRTRSRSCCSRAARCPATTPATRDRRSRA